MFRRITDFTILLPNMLVTNETVETLLQNATHHCLQQLTRNISFMERPAHTYDRAPMKIEFLEPLFHLVTSKYIDMEQMLNYISVNFIGMY